MAVIQYEVSIRNVPNKYGSQSRLIKDLITHFESAQQDRISNNQKKMVGDSNQHQMFWWVCANICFQILHQSYTEWELQSTCIARTLSETTHPVIFQEYGVPKSSLNRDLQKIYPVLQSMNPAQTQNRVEVGEIYPGKVIEIIKFSVGMKKPGRPTYLNEDKDSFVIASANI